MFSHSFPRAVEKALGYSDCLFVAKTGFQLAGHKRDRNKQILTGNNSNLAGQVARSCKGKTAGERGRTPGQKDSSTRPTLGRESS